MLVFEKGKEGRGLSLLPAGDVDVVLPGEKDKREKELHLPELSENELSQTLHRACEKVSWSERSDFIRLALAL